MSEMNVLPNSPPSPPLLSALAYPLVVTPLMLALEFPPAPPAPDRASIELVVKVPP
jgi:hypothetical protein